MIVSETVIIFGDEQVESCLKVGVMVVVAILGEIKVTMPRTPELTTIESEVNTM